MFTKVANLTLVYALVVLIAQSVSGAGGERRSLRGTQVSRQVLRLTPSITKDPNRYVDRTEDGVIDALGGSDESEDAVRRSLNWLANQQKPDGHWEETKSPIAHTGLAMLCFYSYGASHAKEGPYQKTLIKALNWMLKQVGGEGELSDGGRLYDQSIGTLALAEAYGASEDEGIKSPLERAVNYLVVAQNPNTGGWKYKPYHVKAHQGDLSVTGWAVMALASAQLSGISVSQEAKAKAMAFLDRVGTGRKKGMYGYETPTPKRSMVAVGMYSLELLVGTKKTPRMEESLRYLMTHLPDKKQKDFYYWYYGTLTLRLYGGDGWEEWNSRMAPILLELQSEEGSWEPMGGRAKQEGRIVTTAWATLCLEVYYRYTPLGKINPRVLRGNYLSLKANGLNGGQPYTPFSRPSTRPNSGRPQ